MKISSSDKRATSERLRAASPSRRGSDLLAATAALLVTLASAASCGSAHEAARAEPVAIAGASTPPLSAPVDFAFDSLDERPVNSDTTRGAPTVLSFITTSSLSSQAQVDFLMAMAKNDGDRVHYAVVALEGRGERELVELYKKALAIPFPVGLADVQTSAGVGAFGDVSAVPVTVLLDRAGRVVWRIDGRVVKSDELRRELRGL